MGFALDYPMGYTPEQRQSVVSFATRGVEQQEAARKEKETSRLARMGVLGTGFETPEMQRIERGTAAQKAGIQESVAIQELQSRIGNLATTSGISSNLMSRLFETEQIPEMLSAGRRGEGARNIDQMLNYMGMLMGGQRGMMDPYLQAIMAQGQYAMGGESLMDYLPMLAYLELS